MPDRPLDLQALERAHLPCPHAAGDGPDPDCTLCALAAVLAALRALRHQAWLVVTTLGVEDTVVLELAEELDRVRDG